MKENETVNSLAKIYGDHLGLKDSVKQKIDEIVKGASFNQPRKLADAYLGDQETLPVHFRTINNLENTYMIAATSQRNPQEEKSIKNKFDLVKKEIFIDMEKRIQKNTLTALEKEYSKQTLNDILKALIDFGVVLRGSPGEVDDVKKVFSYFKKKHQGVIGSAEILLKKAGLSGSEKEVIQGIKSRHEDHLKRLAQYKKEVTLNPIQEILLNFGVTMGPLLGFKPETWTREYLKQFYGSFIVKKPHGRPRKVVLKALAIIIYRLLEKKGKQVKWRYGRTADLINQGLGTNLTSKDINNALHSS